MAEDDPFISDMTDSFDPLDDDPDDDSDLCPTCRAPFDEPHHEGCPDAPDDADSI